MKHILAIVLVALLNQSLARAQTVPSDTTSSYLRMSWKHVATGMPSAWYGSEEAKSVAETVLLAQKASGGWAKNLPYHAILSETQKSDFQKSRTEVGGTFDNGATTTELRFLAKIYAKRQDERYRQAFTQGLDYILRAQYENGGWPQFFPVRDSESVAYSGHITYNDNAMVNILNFLDEVATNQAGFASLHLPDADKTKARHAFDRGIDCILKTQIRVAGTPTVWCAQHDEKTLAPAKARKYELESFSGAESAGITQLLMHISNPSPPIIAAVRGAVVWFESHQLAGIQLEKETGPDGKKNVIVVKSEKAPPLWARFYDLETEKPFFCDRDGIKKNTLAEIGYERRNGYSWYTNAPAKVLSDYPGWLKRIGGK